MLELSSWLPTIVSASAALAAWIPFLSKKPELTVHVFVEKMPYPLPKELQGLLPLSDPFSRTAEVWSIVTRIENCGDYRAENIKLNIKYVFENDPSDKIVKKISSELFPKENTHIHTHLDKHNIANKNNYIEIALYYTGKRSLWFLFLRKKHYSRKSTWYFHIKGGQLISNDLQRVESS